MMIVASTGVLLIAFRFGTIYADAWASQSAAQISRRCGSARLKRLADWKSMRARARAGFFNVNMGNPFLLIIHIILLFSRLLPARQKRMT